MRLLKIILLMPVALLMLTLLIAFFDPDSNYRFGRLIDATTSSRGLANFWYDRAANGGHTKAQSISGLYYLYGYGPQNKNKGVDYLEKAVDSEDKSAITYLATAYTWGLGVKQDYKKVLELNQQLVKLNNYNSPRDEAQIAHVYTSAMPPLQDFQKGRAIYEALCACGEQDDSANMAAGIYHFYGLGTGQDFKKAVSYLESAALLGSEEARSKLGLCYLIGLGLSEQKKDAKKAAYWLNLAAKEGNLDAQMVLTLASKLMLFGDDQSHNSYSEALIKRGFSCFKTIKDKQFASRSEAINKIKVEAQSDLNSLTIYGVMTYFGLTGDPALILDDSLLEKASSAGNLDAKVLLAHNRIESLAAEHQKSSVATLKEAWNKGHNYAGAEYANCLAVGVGCTQNWDEIFRVLDKADLDLEPSARYIYGHCFLYGLGADRDVRRGFKEIVGAAKANLGPAYLQLLNNYEYFDSSDKDKLNPVKIARGADKLKLPRVKYKVALTKSNKQAKEAFLRDAASKGLIRAQIELARFYDHELYDTKSAIKFYQMAIDAGRREFLSRLEYLQVEQFGRNFERIKNSQKVLLATRNIKAGELIKRSDFKIGINEDYVSDNYLDDKEECIKFLVGKHCMSNLSEAEEISLSDIGVPEKLTEQIKSKRKKLYVD